jgi:NTP pyrophosphatase (non-canonical NTP hydrolase)
MTFELDRQSLELAGRILAQDCHAASVAGGWYTNPVTGERLQRNVGEMLMLIVSEVAEAMEGYRKGLADDHLPDRLMIEVELADAVIRIGDLAGYLGLDLGGAIAAKMAYNQTRADHKPAARAAAGGKAF